LVKLQYNEIWTDEDYRAAAIEQDCTAYFIFVYAGNLYLYTILIHR
jgi:hypothetical protein